MFIFVHILFPSLPNSLLLKSSCTTFEMKGTFFFLMKSHENKKVPVKTFMKSSSMSIENINVVLVSFAPSLLAPDSEISSYMHETGKT